MFLIVCNAYQYDLYSNGPIATEVLYFERTTGAKIVEMQKHYNKSRFNNIMYGNTMDKV